VAAATTWRHEPMIFGRIVETIQKVVRLGVHLETNSVMTPIRLRAPAVLPTLLLSRWRCAFHSLRDPRSPRLSVSSQSVRPASGHHR
jgi:hypothetical protein